MKHQKFTLAVTVLALLVGSALAQAQSKATVDIKFKFFARSVAMPAGTYTFEQSGSGAILMRGTGTDAKGRVLPIITVLGRHDNDQFAELVFDVLPDGPHLSEIWFPGGIDGALVWSSEGPHKHQVMQSK